MPQRRAAVLRPPSLLALPSYLAGSVAKVGNAPLAALLRERRLSLAQYAVLVALSDFGPLAPHDLATRLQTDRSHISSYVESLLRRDLVNRINHETDRRRITVTLTDSGRLMIDELIVAAARSQETFLDALSTDEQRTLRSLLIKIIDAADQPC